jgi:hypothetical protein
VEEAKFSFNIKFLFQGYDCCFTVREDQPGKAPELVDKALQVINYLGTKGALPVKPSPVKPSAAAAPAGEKSAAVRQPAAGKSNLETPICNYCESSTHVELIKFQKDGNPREAWKCQACNKWLR